MSIDVDETTTITIPVKNLIGIGVALAMFTGQFFMITSRISTLEEDNRRHAEELEEISAFRSQWLRGEKGMLGVDIEQNIRLNHMEDDIIDLDPTKQRKNR